MCKPRRNRIYKVRNVHPLNDNVESSDEDDRLPAVDAHNSLVALRTLMLTQRNILLELKRMNLVLQIKLNRIKEIKMKMELSLLVLKNKLLLLNLYKLMGHVIAVEK
ncbi:unnamed protein product [Ceutorhynchus assimilis]|uniref:Uncharacterized protein n=1 Tax=Ceutorhynchus assimilis TaxID=467358 RepID=A0A9N9MZ02_9CUCU|nr:unnamed protein product [Ceutorhynchus assimilis]